MSSFLKDKDDENESFLLHEIARGMRTSFDRRCQPLGLTRSQWHVLAILRRHEGINQSALAQKMEIEPISLVRLLDRMESSGMIERRPDATDRRANRLYLTPKVMDTISQMRNLSMNLRKQALNGFTDKEHKQFLSFLHRVKANVSSILGDSA